MTLIQDTPPQIILVVIVIALAIIISTRGQGSASEINEQVQSKFDKDKLKVNPLVSDNTKICFETDNSALRITENEPLFVDYNEFVKEEEFVLTLDVMDAAESRHQLSSKEKIKCVAAGGRCSIFPSRSDFTFEFRTIPAPPQTIQDTPYVRISVWKAIGITTDEVFMGDTDALIRKKADYYLTTFTLNRC
ncbi:MAG: hypothetical protein HYW27_00610 [Candidatus Aenigmarchaeota archaeon]|nr:hypothetical protein [Candidatus Aenigmarchaeota archaeon]